MFFKLKLLKLLEENYLIVYCTVSITAFFLQHEALLSAVRESVPKRVSSGYMSRSTLIAENEPAGALSVPL